MLNILRKIIPERSGIRLLYHKWSAALADWWYGHPGRKLTVIGVTGTSGKSSTVEILHHLLQASGKPCGAISSIQLWIGEKPLPNVSLRTTLRPWETQKHLKAMVKHGCTHAVIEVSSHALDQNRLWGIPFHTAVLTNISDNEHLDYHHTFADYIQTKRQLFVPAHGPSPKVVVIDTDEPHKELFFEGSAETKWTFGTNEKADIFATKTQFSTDKTQATLHTKREAIAVTYSLVGEHNLKNLLAASAVALSQDIPLDTLRTSIQSLPGIPGRLEAIEEGQNFTVLVDHTYKPSALGPVLKTLKEMTPGNLFVVWGGAGGRAPENWQASARIIQDLADVFVLTTDDPYEVNPLDIVEAVSVIITRKEGEGFFEISDRYEAMRYALLTAQKGDTVLIAGRGTEQTQTIGKRKIPFDDRVIACEILQDRG